MPHTDTITALASPPGRSPRAILRIAGPATQRILKTLLKEPPTTRGAFTTTLGLPTHQTSPQRKQGTSPPSSSSFSPTSCLRASVPSCLPVPCAVLHFPAPNSYTTDHVTELLLPGNSHLTKRVLDAVLACDAPDHPVRLAEPGEFTQRAYLAGKLTLDQAEGVAALIAVDRDDEFDEARDLLAGTTGDRYRAWTDDLATMLALVEAGIDFTDQEDVVPIAPADLVTRINELHTSLRAHAGQPAEAHSESPVVALIGPPSAGKSTLFNALLGRERAVTDEAPGTTRDAIAEPLRLQGGETVTLMDLPGLDITSADPLDREAQRRAIEAARRADLLIHCDPAGRFTPDPRLLDTPTLRVRTKADLLHASANELEVCALDGYHLHALRDAIADRAIARGSSVVPRHARALAAAAEALAAASDAVDPTAHALNEPELVAGALRDGLDQLGSITGTITPDEVIGRVFAAFCVGK